MSSQGPFRDYTGTAEDGLLPGDIFSQCINCVGNFMDATINME